MKRKRADQRMTLIGPCLAHNDGVLAYLCRHRRGEAPRPAAGGGVRDSSRAHLGMWTTGRRGVGAAGCRVPAASILRLTPAWGLAAHPGDQESAPRWAPCPATSSPPRSLGVPPRRATIQRIRLTRPLSVLPWARRRVPDAPAPLRPGGRRPSSRLHQRISGLLALEELKGVRPPIEPSVRGVIRHIWRSNLTWGAPRIQAELCKLGIDVSDSTIRRYRGPHHGAL